MRKDVRRGEKLELNQQEIATSDIKHAGIAGHHVIINPTKPALLEEEFFQIFLQLVEIRIRIGILFLYHFVNTV